MGANRGPSPSRPVPISLSLHPAIKTCHVGDFPRRHLSEDLIHHQPSTRPPSSDIPAGLTVAATISIAYLVFSSLSASLDPMGVCRGPDCPEVRLQVPVTKSASGNVGFGDLFSLIRNTRACGARTRGQWAHSSRATHPGRPRAIVGSRSSGVPGRPGPGTGGSSQKVC